jgi:hypothetical protein
MESSRREPPEKRGDVFRARQLGRNYLQWLYRPRALPADGLRLNLNETTSPDRYSSGKCAKYGVTPIDRLATVLRHLPL